MFQTSNIFKTKLYFQNPKQVNLMDIYSSEKIGNIESNMWYGDQEI